MAEKMQGRQGCRIKSLTRDTSLGIQQTCTGLIELSKYLLDDGQEYVLLGEFTTDYLETMFGELRQGSGGAYFINVQNVVEKFHIKKASLFLRLLEVATDTSPGHSCEKRSYGLDEAGCSVADNLPELKDNLSDEVRMSLVYISGYVSKSSGLEDEDTSFYFQMHGSYLKNLDRGGLKAPSDNCCQWTIFCYIIFNFVKDVTCRKSLSNIFHLVSEKYDFKMTYSHCRTLSKIFFKNYCSLCSPLSNKEHSLKRIKLSVYR